MDRGDQWELPLGPWLLSPRGRKDPGPSLSSDSDDFADSDVAPLRRTRHGAGGTFQDQVMAALHRRKSAQKKALLQQSRQEQEQELIDLYRERVARDRAPKKKKQTQCEPVTTLAKKPKTTATASSEPTYLAVSTSIFIIG